MQNDIVSFLIFFENFIYTDKTLKITIDNMK